MSSNYKKDRHEMDFSSNWLITFSDMITIILCFFIIFFSLTAKEVSFLTTIRDSLSAEVEGLNTQVNKLHQENEKLKVEKESLAQKLFQLGDLEADMKTSKEDFITFLRENDLLDSVHILQNERGLLIRFRDSVLFNSGSAEITKEGYAALHKIGDKLKTIDNKIIVEGFTDNLPIRTSEYPSNWELSVARAIHVVKFFTKEKSIAEDRVSVSGFGERNPIDTNSTPQGRANNRRIEITIVN